MKIRYYIFIFYVGSREAISYIIDSFKGVCTEFSGAAVPAPELSRALDDFLSCDQPCEFKRICIDRYFMCLFRNFNFYIPSYLV